MGNNRIGMEYTTGMRLRFIRDVLVREKTMRIRVLHGANRTAKLHEIDEAIEIL